MWTKERIWRTVICITILNEEKNKMSQIKIGHLQPDMTNIKQITEQIVDKTHELFYQVSNIY